MKDLEFLFDQSPWEAAFSQLQPGDSLSAVRFLTVLEDADETEAEEALTALTDRHITLDIQALPKAPGTGAAAVRLRQEEQLVRSGKLYEGLEENDPLRLYLQEVAQIPAAGDPEVLAQTLRDGDDSVTQRIVDLMLSHVIGLSQEYVGRGVLLLDLIQEASLGLWQGIQSYTGGDFTEHCVWCIRQSLAGAVTFQARAAGVGQKLRQALEDYRTVDEKLLTELGRNPTVEEIAEGLHMSVQETVIIAEMLENVRSLQRARMPEPEDIPQEEDQAVEDTAYFQMRQRISELLSSLSQQDAKLLTLRYGLEGGLPMDPQQVGRQLGLTPEEVVAREATALAKLRQQK